MKTITTLALSLLSAGLIGCGAPQDVPVATRTAKLTSAALRASYNEAYCYTKFAGANNRANCLANFPSDARVSDAGVGAYAYGAQLVARIEVNSGGEYVASDFDLVQARDLLDNPDINTINTWAEPHGAIMSTNGPSNPPAPEPSHVGNTIHTLSGDVFY